MSRTFSRDDVSRMLAGVKARRPRQAWMALPAAMTALAMLTSSAAWAVTAPGPQAAPSGKAAVPPRPAKAKAQGVQAGPQPTWQASLQPGCLAPHPSVLAQAGRAAGQLRIATDVDDQGRPRGWHVLEGSGTPAADALVLEAVKRCAFAAPAGKPAGAPARHVLMHAWDDAQAALGPGRCFAPDYPAAALAEGATGRIELTLQRAEGSDEVVLKAQWLQGQHPALMAASLEAAQACLKHDSVRRGIPAGPVHSVIQDWTL